MRDQKGEVRVLASKLRIGIGMAVCQDDAIIVFDDDMAAGVGAEGADDRALACGIEELPLVEVLVDVLHDDVACLDADADIDPVVDKGDAVLLQGVHDRGVVHLDTRGTGNWLVSPEGKPLLIDFQASLTTGWMPASLRRIIELVDMSGVYKKWKEWQPQTMGEERQALYEEALYWRRKWVFEGYFGKRKRRRARKKRKY